MIASEKLHNPLQVNQIGLAALEEKLGKAGTIIFLQQYDRGSGDYTKERSESSDRRSVDEICNDINTKKAAKN